MADEVHEQLYKFTADEESLLRGLRRLEAELTDASRKKYDIRLVLASKEVREELKVIEKELKEFESSGPHSTKVDVIVAKALSDVRRLNESLDRLPLNKTVTVAVRDQASKTLRNVERDTFQLVGHLGQLDKALGGGSGLDQGAGKLDKLSHAARRAALFLRRLPSYIAGISITILASLLPAVFAAIAGLAGMTVSLGGLVSALAAEAIPVIGVFATAISRVNAVMDVFNLLQSAQQAKIRAGVSDARKDATANAGRAAAHRQVADAQRAEQRASDDLKQAQQELGAAATAALEEMAQAARDARDAVLDLAQAQLSQEQAELNLDKAKLELQDFRDGLGLTAEAFDTMFAKFTDVNFQFDEKALEKIIPGSGDDAKKDQIELAQLILNVRQAKLDERQATNSLADSEDNLTKARRENAAFMKEGIAHSETYQAALDRVTQANLALEDAERNTSQALKDKTTSMGKLAAATDGADTAAAIYRSELKKLSPAEREFLDAIRDTRKQFREFSQEITAPIFRGLASGLRDAPALLKHFKGGLKDLASEFVNVGDIFKKQIGFDIKDGTFDKFLNGAVRATQSWGRVLLGAYNITKNLALAAMPFLNRIVADIGDKFIEWGEALGDTDKVRQAMAPGFALMRIVIDAIAQTARGLFGVFKAGHGPINKFFGEMRDGIKAFADWTESKRGREQIKKFFEDTLPIVKALIKFFIRFSVLVLRTIQFFAPGLKLTFDLLSLISDAVTLLIQVFELLAIPLRIIIDILDSIVNGLDEAVQAFTGFIEDILFVFRSIVKKVKDFLGISSPSKVFKEIGIAMLRGLILGLIRAPLAILNIFKRLIGAGINWLRDRVPAVFEIGAHIARAIGNGIKSAAQAVWNAIKAIWEKIKKFFEDRFDDAKRFGEKIGNAIKDGVKFGLDGLKAIVQAAIGGVKTVINGFIALFNGVFKKRKLDVPDFFPGPDSITIPGLHINPLAAGGLTKGRTLAELGEGRFQEAVIPLSAAVFKKLGRAIGASMSLPSFSPVVAGGGGRFTQGTSPASRGGSVIEHVDVHLPAPPAGGIPDPRYSAAQFAREIKRRGW